MAERDRIAVVFPGQGSQAVGMGRAFYEGTLGFEPLIDQPAGVMYGSGDGTRFLVFPSGGSASGTHTQMGFTAQDIEAEVADLRSRGGGCRASGRYSPDGRVDKVSRRRCCSATAL